MNDAKVPARLRRVLTRGLKTEPSDRFATVHALAKTLDAIAAPRRRWVLGTVGVVAVASVAFALGRSDTLADGCEQYAAEISSVWNATARDELRLRFAQTGRSYAERLTARAVADLDAYAARWRDARRQTCRTSPDPSAGGPRQACLDAARVRLDELVRTMRGATDPDVLDGAVSWVAALPRPARCASAPLVVVAAEHQGASPDVDRALARVEALKRAREGEQAAAEAEAAIAEADRRGSTAQRAEARRLYAWMVDDRGDAEAAEPALWEALRLGSEAGADATVVKTIAALLVGVGLRTERIKEAVSWIPFGDAALARAGHEPETAALWNRNVAMLLAFRGDVEGALSRWETAGELVAESHGSQSCRYGGVLAGEADALLRLRRYAEALERLEPALAACRAELPPDLAKVARMLRLQGAALVRMGDPDAAAVRVEEALSIVESLEGQLAPVYAVLHSLSQIRSDQGRTADAVALARRGLSHLEDERPGQPVTAYALGRLAEALMEAGEGAEALLRAREALAILERHDLADSGTTAGHTWITLGRAECYGAEVAEGKRSIMRGREILERLGETVGVARAEEELASCVAVERGR